MNGQFQDIRYGLRGLVRNPGFTAVVVGVLALGIGANGAIFSLLDAFLFRPLPYPDSDRIVVVTGDNPHLYGDEIAPVSYPDFTDWKNQNDVFEHMAAMEFGKLNFASAGEPERVEAVKVSDGYFAVFKVSPVVGRVFTGEECGPGGERVVILSYATWQSRFGASVGVIGQVVTIDGFPHTIIGVMPAGSEPVLEPAVWVPLRPGASEANRANHTLLPIARLKPGITIEQAGLQMAAIARRLEQEYPETDKGWGIRVQRFHEGIYGPAAPFLFLLLAAVGCVLLLVCTNVAGLLVARGSTREREIAVRAALGASRWRVVRQLLMESTLLSVISGMVALLVALWITDVLTTGIAELGLPVRMPQIRIDLRVLCFTFSASLLTALVSGLVPALQSSRVDLGQCLKDAGRSISAARSRRRLRNGLIVAEVTLSLVLLVGAALLVQGFIRLSRTDPGFTPQNVLALSLPLSPARYETPARQARFFAEFVERVASLPGVQSAGVTSSYPMSGHNSSRTYLIEGRARPAPGQDFNASFHVVSSSYFATLRIPLLRGRSFGESDSQDAPAVVVINNTIAQQQFANDNPLGHRIQIGGGPWRTIVGVTGDVRYTGLGNPVQAEMCVPLPQWPQPDMEAVVRVGSDPAPLVGAIRKEMQAMDPSQPLAGVRRLEVAVAESVWPQKGVLLFLTAFAVMAIALTVLGVYGVVAHTVAQRTREIGIRLALGAQPRSVLLLSLRQGAVLVAIGLALGLVAALALMPALAALLYGVNPADPMTLLGVSALLASVTMIASYIPARRATRIETIFALREQ